MGYFSTSNDPSPEAQLASALKNIELWEELETGGEYLISGFVKSQIQDALNKLMTDKHNSQEKTNDQ